MPEAVERSIEEQSSCRDLLCVCHMWIHHTPQPCHRHIRSSHSPSFKRVTMRKSRLAQCCEEVIRYRPVRAEGWRPSSLFLFHLNLRFRQTRVELDLGVILLLTLWHSNKSHEKYLLVSVLVIFSLLFFK